MKLTELAATKPSKQAAKVFESYFGQSIRFDALTRSQANSMLSRVRKLISEHRQTPEFHTSEKDASYLKLVMLETALAAKMREGQTLATTQSNAPGTTTPGQPVAGVVVPGQPKPTTQQLAQQQTTIKTGQQNTQGDGTVNPGSMSAQEKQQITNIQMRKNQGAKLTPDEQTALANQSITTQESRRKVKENRLYNMLRESEVQQAQVVLAAQDMVDEVQQMLEKVTAMQFKDLPALVDQIKYQVGVDQATQFNTDAGAALGGLVDNLQGARGQLEGALGVVTGQEAVIPGQQEEVPQPGEEEIDVDVGAEELPEPEPEFPEPETDLGRERR